MRLALLVLLVGCGGDPRTPFHGVYDGVGKQTVSFSCGTDVFTDSVSFTITLPAKSDRIQFSGSCAFTAHVLDADTFEFDPKTCPTRRGETNSGAMADFTLVLK